MDRIWWQLAGPTTFISSIIDAVRDGTNVVVSLPAYHPGGIDEAVERHLDTTHRWRRLPLDDRPVIEPLQRLLDDFEPEPSARRVPTLSTLLACRGFRGHVVWVANMTPTSWAQWRPFLEEYAHACRALSLIERSVFCVPLVGELAASTPREDVCLTSRGWQGVVEPLDMLLYAHRLLRDREFSGLVRDVAAAVIARLALWDGILARSLEPVMNLRPSLRIGQPDRKLWRMCDASYRRCTTMVRHRPVEPHDGPVSLRVAPAQSS